MAKMTLSGSQTQKSISRFIFEAKECARQELGFAAMQIIFSVILAVSEAINPELRRDEDLFKAFVPEMVKKPIWLIAPEGLLSNEDIAEKLSDIRNALAHQLSLPRDVCLANTRVDAEEIWKRRPKMYIISTTELVDTIETTVHKLTKANPNAMWDPRPRIPRGPASRVVELLDATTSGSFSSFDSTEESVNQST
jgi:hypothetical protein